MASSSPEFVRLAQSIMNRAENVQRNADKIVEDTFVSVARMVVIHTPLWSGQAKLNWTASVGTRVPPKRFVNVSRLNTRVRKKKGGGTSLGGREGTLATIQVDPRIKFTAQATAIGAITSVAGTYRHPIRPSNALPRALDVQQKAVGKRSLPKFYLRNSLSYIADLWDGSNRNNPRRLEDELDFGLRTIRSRKLLTRG